MPEYGKRSNRELVGIPYAYILLMYVYVCMYVCTQYIPYIIYRTAFFSPSIHVHNTRSLILVVPYTISWGPRLLLVPQRTHKGCLPCTKSESTSDKKKTS